MGIIKNIKTLFIVLKVIKKVKENEKMEKIISWFSGKKTYLFTAGWAIYKIGVASGWLEENPAIEAILVGGGAASLRAGVKKSGN